MLFPYLPGILNQNMWYILNTYIVRHRANADSNLSSPDFIHKIDSQSECSQLGRSLIRLDQHLREVGDLLSAADLLNQERHLHDVEVLAIEVVDLLEVLLLHLTAAVALGARVRGAGEEELVNNDGAGVNFVVAELLDHALGFVEGEELGDHDGDEAGGWRLVIECQREIG